VPSIKRGPRESIDQPSLQQRVHLRDDVGQHDEAALAWCWMVIYRLYRAQRRKRVKPGSSKQQVFHPRRAASTGLMHIDRHNATKVARMAKRKMA
jgi:hypothetical protein